MPQRSYLHEITSGAWSQTWDFLVGSKPRTVLFTILVPAGAIWIQRQYMGQSSIQMKDAIYSLGAGVVALGIFYFAIFAVHCCYITPKRAWIELSNKLKGKSHREILKGIVDATGIIRGLGSVTSEYRIHPLISLIKASDEFGDENDVEAVCSQLEETGHGDPFSGLECKYGIGSFTGKRLKLLRDARVAEYNISDEDDVFNYVYSIWADRNDLKEPEWL
jgi:hypothetical protein